MRYLKGTAGYGIVYRRNTDDNIMTDTVSINHSWSLVNCLLTHPELNLVTKSNILNLYAYVDADHGRDIDTRRSVTAYVFYLGGSPICWKSKLQQCVATSSMQSEYMALCAATLQSLWLITIIRTIGYSKLNPITLLEDNQSCI